MKKIILASTVFIALGFLALNKLEFRPFMSHQEKILVTVQYKDEEKQLELEPYTTLKEVLELIHVDDELDLDRINENQILHHNDKIKLPIIQDVPCVSINHADKETLMTLKGVGETVADRIITYRNEQGYFQNIEDIMEVNGIGIKTFEKMQSMLCI